MMIQNTQEMGCRVQTLETQLVPPPPDEERMRQIAAIENKQKDTLRMIHMIEEGMSEDEQAVAKLTDDMHQIQLEAAMSKEVQAKEVPKASHSLSLYTNITGIRWDYSDPSLLAGVINTNHDVREFEIDPSTMTKCEIADALWELLDTR
jgi:hypothetical protein